MTPYTPPYLVSWNITRRCDLACSHCYLDSEELAGTDAVSTPQALSIVNEVSKAAPGAMLILTGGEPLKRPDLFEIARQASSEGLTVAVGTNGACLDRATAEAMKEGGVRGVGVSLDSIAPAFHDRFRGVEGAWERTVAGMDALATSGLPFQVQFTVTAENRTELGAVAELARAKGAVALNVFFLVCTGRGQRRTDLSPEEYEAALVEVVRLGARYKDGFMVRARCAPHVVRVAGQTDPEGPVAAGGTAGCVAGRGYLRIDPEGFVTPCPYIPATARSMNILDTPLEEIMDRDPAFAALGNPGLKGRCGECEFAETCGGCRARALALTGDLMETDPWCGYEPRGAVKTKTTEPVWTPAAEERLERAPRFLRAMIRKGVEGYARSKGVREITPEIMAELRARTGLK